MNRIFSYGIRIVLPALLSAALAACGTDDPDLPASLAAPQPRQDIEATTPHKVTIVWDAVDNAAGYNCVLDESAPFYTETPQVTYGALAASTSHTFRVMAITRNASLLRNSEWSRTITVTTASEE